MLVLDKKIRKENRVKSSSNERVKAIEMDELYTYSERKNKIYVITLANREKRQIVGYCRVTIDVTPSTIQKRLSIIEF